MNLLARFLRWLRALKGQELVALIFILWILGFTLCFALHYHELG
jgi:hypothetical protein